MSGFFAELQRRKVYRVAAAYIVAAGFIIQITSAVFPAWELPNWTFRLLVVLVLAGFPIALIFAWIFDVTPSGIERTSQVQPQTAPKSHRRRNLILLASAGLAISVAAGFFVLPRASARKIDKSIAVLPFENFSDDKENAYFADGIQDDILTNLSKIGDLKVISRTSVMGYRGNARNVREIAKTLGVSNVLEGSVRRYGNKVRVNVQLIDGTNDQHVWAEDYDGDLTDVFKIQTDLAMKIASALQAKLSPTEKAQLERKPTENQQAYLAFVQAHDMNVGLEDFPRLKQAEQTYDEALRLDPKFALASARASQLQSWIFHSFDPTPARRQKARDLAERALQLEPNLPEAHLARGMAYYYGDRNYDAALSEFAKAQQGLPNDSDVYLAIGAIQRRQGKWQESTANLLKAVELNPKASWPLQNLAFNYEMLRDPEATNRTIDRALALDPKNIQLLGLKAQFAIEQRGDFSVAEKAFAEIGPITDAAAPATAAASATPGPVGIDPAYIASARINVLMLQRKFQEVVREARKIDDSALIEKPESVCGKYALIGVALRYLHDEAGARRELLKAKGIAQQAVSAAPESASRRMQLAQVMAWLGEKDAAIAEGQRAQQLQPESVDAFEGPQITGQLAEVYAVCGEANHAVDLLEGLFNRPSALTVHLLNLQVTWDGMRGNPRFKALLGKYGGKT